MMFRLNGIDPDAAGEAWRTIPELMDSGRNSAASHFPRKAAIVRPQKHSDRMAGEFHPAQRADGSAVNGIDADDLTAAKSRAGARPWRFFDFLRREAPGFANSYIVDMPPQLGIRETRRVTGAYLLSAEDVLGCAALPTPSASMAGRWKAMSPAT